MTKTQAVKKDERATPRSVEVLAREYIAAWQRSDLPAIDALHADNVQYHLHGFQQPVTGRRAVLDNFARQFEDTPDAVLTVADLQFGPAHFVLQSTVTGNSKTRGPITLDAVDVITVQDGVVATKDAYVTSSKVKRDPTIATVLSATAPGAKHADVQFVNLGDLDARLDRSRSKPYLRGLANGTMATVIYAPQIPDLQTPHTQDEIYVIARGRGQLRAGAQVFEIQPGDAIFVPAHQEHRFESHGADFLTWVILWGPEGGERNT